MYKYLVAERIDVLKHARIRFSQPSALNDPIEMQPSLEGAGENPQVRSSLEQILAERFEHALLLTYYMSPESHTLSFDEFKARAEQEAPETAQILSRGTEQAMFSLNDTEMLRRIRKEFYEAIDKEVGVLSLTERPDNLIMWAHYAQQHQGFVIEFDETHPYFNQKPTPDETDSLLKVKYSVDRPAQALMTGMDVLDMLLTKSKDWEYEQEWRLLRDLQEADLKMPNPMGDVHLFSFTPECLKGVILGARMLGKDRAEVLNLINDDARYKHVNVYQSSTDDMRFQLNYRTHSADGEISGLTQPNAPIALFSSRFLASCN